MGKICVIVLDRKTSVRREMAGKREKNVFYEANVGEKYVEII